MALVEPANHHERSMLSAIGRSTTLAASDAVTQSWERCIRNQLDPGQNRTLPVLEENRLKERRERAADVIESAKLEMSTLYQLLGDDQCAVVLTDSDGVIVHMVAAPKFAQEASPLGLRPGAIWSEAEAGTNGMGTCLIAAEPLAVRQNEHFFNQYANLTCSAAPIFDPEGNLVAVLDVTSRSALMQAHSLVLLGMTAQTIENRLLALRYRHAHSIQFHSRPEFVHTQHEGRLMVSPSGRIEAANRSALSQLGLYNVAQVRALMVDEIFDVSLDEMLQRSSRSAYQPVATYRANSASRVFSIARQAADRQVIAAPVSTPLAAPKKFAAPAQPTPEFGDARLSDQLSMAAKVIRSGIPVLLHGETGSGKEVLAKALHQATIGEQGKLVAVNCASIPETLIESELFGYRAGAFTGAQRQGRRGKILQADGGTLFLDEIGDMPLALQARLLRVLDEHEVTPLGSEETIPVTFQLISASHRDLIALVREGRFREDLYFRICGVELKLPPLRERNDKVALIGRILAEESHGAATLAPDALTLLLNYPWPGNVRQLRHTLRTAVALVDADAPRITPEQLPAVIRNHGSDPMHIVAMGHGLRLASPAEAMLPTPATATPTVPATASAAAPVADALPALNAIQANERMVLLGLLEEHRWNMSNVAKALGISRNTLYRKLHKCRIPLKS